MADPIDGANVELLFSAPFVGSSPVELVFGGEDDVGPILAASFTLDGTFPLPAFDGTLQLAQVTHFAMAGDFPAPAFCGDLVVHYVSNTARPTVGEVDGGWQRANQGESGIAPHMQGAVAAPGGAATGWTRAAGVMASLAVDYETTDRRHAGTCSGFSDALARPADPARSAYQDAFRDRRPAIRSGFQLALAVQSPALRSRFQEAYRDRLALAASHWQPAIGPVVVGVTDSAGVALDLVSGWRAQYQRDMVPPAGIYTPPVAPGWVPCYTPSSALVFDGLTAADAHLVFMCPGKAEPGAPILITFKRVYMASHHLSAKLLPSLAPVPLFNATISADMGSFAWSLAATGPAVLFDQLMPTAGPTAAVPQQLEINLDGMVWTFAVESLTRQDAFGQRGVSIRGRSLTALVGAPWARERAFNQANNATAQQLALQALDLSGVALDWGIVDWLVLGGSFSHLGTPLSAAQAIAEAAGGYLQSHRSGATLQVAHPYPARPDGGTGGPWNWGAGPADIELASQAVITSSMERRDGPDINAVYVSGTTQGVSARVLRAGTAGEKLLGMQTHALITDEPAARQRGLAALGKGGPKYFVDLELPVLTGTNEPGVIDVGRLVQVNASTPWRGRVRGVSVRAAMPSARQTITLERHL